MYQKQGFTLIELLVVVLIIGILSAVALPQYQKAVDKTRFVQLFPMLRTLMRAQEAYYMANGAYSYDNTALDVDVMSACTKGTGSMIYDCDGYVIDANNSLAGVIIVHFCPGTDASEQRQACVENRLLSLRVGYEYSTSFPGRRSCSAISGSKRGAYLCSVFSKEFK